MPITTVEPGDPDTSKEENTVEIWVPPTAVLWHWSAAVRTGCLGIHQHTICLSFRYHLAIHTHCAWKGFSVASPQSIPLELGCLEDDFHGQGQWEPGVLTLEDILLSYFWNLLLSLCARSSGMQSLCHHTCSHSAAQKGLELFLRGNPATSAFMNAISPSGSRVTYYCGHLDPSHVFPIMRADTHRLGVHIWGAVSFLLFNYGRQCKLNRTGFRERKHNLYHLYTLAPFFFFFFCGTGTWTPGLHIETLHQPYFWDRVLQTICPGWLQTSTHLISASWVARIMACFYLTMPKCKIVEVRYKQ
jgi:hypothetical protein